MELRTKKTIAREVLIFFCTAAFLGLMAGALHLAHESYLSRLNTIDDIIKQKHDFKEEVEQRRSRLIPLEAPVEEYHSNLGKWVEQEMEKNPALKIKESAYRSEQDRIYSSMFYGENSRRTFFILCITVVIVVYPIRFIIDTIRWSIRTLRK